MREGCGLYARTQAGKKHERDRRRVQEPNREERLIYSRTCHFLNTPQMARYFDVDSGCMSPAVGAWVSRQRLRISSKYIFLNRFRSIFPSMNFAQASS